MILSIGTKKGLFVAEAAKNRRSFSLRGPFSPGVAVYSALIDTRGTPRLYASSCNPFFGMKVLVSTDIGKKFIETDELKLKTWPQYFAAERAIEKCARASGIPKLRAAQLATDLACRPLPRARAARLLLLAARTQNQVVKVTT